jgi:hypothetical protein
MIDLFTPAISERKLHHNFKILANDIEARKVFENWSTGFVDRDNKFAKQFQETFNSSFWEVYLHAVFGALGFSTDYSFDAPDYYLKKRNTSLLVEAVTTRNPENGTPEHDRLDALNRFLNESKNQAGRDKMHSEVIALASERIVNSIVHKANYFKEKYSQREHVKGKPFIIAVGSYEQPLFYFQAQGAINRVLYGLKKAEYRGDDPYFEYTSNIKKASNGVEIPVGLFNNEKYSNISAVLFSSVATFGKLRALQEKKVKGIFIESSRYNEFGKKANVQLLPHKEYQESLIDGLSLYLNPFASNPVDPELFNSSDIAINYNSDDNKVKHGFLYTRTVLNLSNLAGL